MLFIGDITVAKQKNTIEPRLIEIIGRTKSEEFIVQKYRLKESRQLNDYTTEYFTLGKGDKKRKKVRFYNADKKPYPLEYLLESEFADGYQYRIASPETSMAFLYAKVKLNLISSSYWEEALSNYHFLEYHFIDSLSNNIYDNKTTIIKFKSNKWTSLFKDTFKCNLYEFEKLNENNIFKYEDLLETLAKDKIWTRNSIMRFINEPSITEREKIFHMFSRDSKISFLILLLSAYTIQEIIGSFYLEEKKVYISYDVAFRKGCQKFINSTFGIPEIVYKYLIDNYWEIKFNVDENFVNKFTNGVKYGRLKSIVNM